MVCATEVPEGDPMGQQRIDDTRDFVGGSHDSGVPSTQGGRPGRGAGQSSSARPGSSSFSYRRRSLIGLRCGGMRRQLRERRNKALSSYRRRSAGLMRPAMLLAWGHVDIRRQRGPTGLSRLYLAGSAHVVPGLTSTCKGSFPICMGTGHSAPLWSARGDLACRMQGEKDSGWRWRRTIDLTPHPHPESHQVFTVSGV
jgi:hypothetical protein